MAEPVMNAPESSKPRRELKRFLCLIGINLMVMPPSNRFIPRSEKS